MILFRTVLRGVCLRRSIPDGLRLVEYATENRKSGEYINRLLEKYLRQGGGAGRNRTDRKAKEEKKKSNNDRKCK